jgi:cytochrome c oxidase subunit II
MKKAVFVTLVLAVAMVVPASASTHKKTQPKVIEITAKRFGFSPDNLTLKKGEPVVLRLTSADVTHGFFAREIKVDELIEPGKPLDVTVNPQKSGTFTVICHHFCGAGHGNMKMTVTVVE